MDKQLLLIASLGLLTSKAACAGTYEWTSGWGMGISEYAVADGKGNELVINCPDDEERYVSASATLNDRAFNSEDGQGFDVIVDGKSFSNPFYTDCRACSDIFKAEFWDALLSAHQLQVRAQDDIITLPTQNLKAVLPALDAKDNSCRAAW
jgi:hypothetical protein